MQFNVDVNIGAINFGSLFIVPSDYKRKVSSVSKVTVPVTVPALQGLKCDTVSFTGGAVGGAGKPLKALARYGITDIFSGEPLLAAKELERLQRTGVFRLPLHKMIRIVSHYEEFMRPIDKKFFELLKQTAKKQPDITIEDALVQYLVPKHKKLLIKEQEKVFAKILRYGSELPENMYKELLELLNITGERMENRPVILPFSEREFIYKLGKISEDIRSRHNRKEIGTINRLIKEAKAVFNHEYPRTRHPFGRNKMTKRLKLQNQMRPQILKRNSEGLQKLQDIFENSPLSNNRDLVRLFATTSAKIHGYPTYAPFERKSFIHDLKSIIHNLKNQELYDKLVATAQTLPKSQDNLSAFIVKYAHESNDQIGHRILMNSVASIDHLVAKKNGGANQATNYALCRSGVNSKKTNIFFDEWVRQNPNAAQNCQKHVDRLIELCKAGVFAKVSKGKKDGIDEHYIESLAQTIYNLSPKENKIRLDISKLYE